MNADDWLRKKLRVRRKAGCLTVALGIAGVAVAIGVFLAA